MSDREISGMEPIQRLIRQTRRLLRSSWVATGLALTFALLLGVVLAAAAVDLVVPLWPPLRWIALGLILISVVWAFIAGVVLPALRPLGPRHMARRIENQLPGIHNRLVSCVDLTTAKETIVTSPAFRRRLLQEALDRIRGFHPASVIDSRSVRRAAVSAVAALAVFVVAWLLLSDRLPTAMARVFKPWADIPPATSVRYEVDRGDASVLRGDEVPFIVRVTKGEPEILRLDIEPEDGSPTIRHDLKKLSDGTWTFALRGFEKSFNYRVVGGGTWTPKHHVEMVDRPKIIELQTSVHYPDYMRMPEPRFNQPQVADVTGPEQGKVEVNVKVEGDVAQGEIQLVSPASKQIAVTERPEREWFVDKLPPGGAAEGIWQWDPTTYKRLTHTEALNAAAHFHRFANATTPFQMQLGDALYAYVFIPADKKPETILLEWHDGTNWEHRAYWGADKFKDGQPNTPSRMSMGPLPEADKWVRLEVPAAAVGLDGKGVKGMGFSLFGGQCFWNGAGAVPAATRTVQELVRVAGFPMHDAGESHWSGTFPLEKEGLYRVHLLNKIGAPNQTMKEGKFTAIPDNPPQVVLERPGTDMTLAAPQKVPLVIAAYDDFCLDQIALSVQKGDSGGFQGSTVKKYDKVVRGDNALVTLDLAKYDLKPGEHIRYRVESRDRKGQTAQTQDYMISIVADDNAADRQLAKFDKSQDAFLEKLLKLIGDQSKVTQSVEAITAKYVPLEDKLREATIVAQEAAAVAAGPGKDPGPLPPLQLDAESAKQLAEMRKEFAEAAALEEQNAAMAKQLATELGQSVDQAAQLKMLPPEVLDEIRATQKAFGAMAVDPIAQMAAKLKQTATATDQSPPQLAELKQLNERLSKELDAIAERLKALEESREHLGTGVDEALAKLREEILKQKAGLTEREISQVLDRIAVLRKQLMQMEDRQSEFLEAGKAVPEALLADLKKRQDILDRESEEPLSEAERMLQKSKPKRMKRDPKFPDAPYQEEGKEEMVGQAEADVPDEAEKKDDKTADAGKKGAKEAGEEKKNEEDEMEKTFQPALGGPKPKLDPRLADKRPTPKKQKSGEEAGSHEREDLNSRQFDRLAALDLAQQGLGSDQKSLQDLLEKLEEAAGEAAAEHEGSHHEGSPHQGGQHEGGSKHGGSEGADALAELMQSPAMQQAMAMAQRMQSHGGGKPGGSQQSGPPKPGQTPPPQTNAQGIQGGGMFATGPVNNEEQDKQLKQLDLPTRTVILKMQPRLREELLQGMREQGPEGYQQFIRDYFQRLTEVNGPTK